MWWDWNAITILDSALFSIVSLLAICFVGSGILRLISKVSRKPNLLKPFDFLQKVNLGIVFGLIFIFLTVYLFSIFSAPFWLPVGFVLVLSFVGFLLVHPRIDLSQLRCFGLQDYAVWLTIAVVLLVTIFLSSNLISGYYGTTNDDGSFHTLVTRVILDNPNALISRSTQPIANFTLLYPSGTHVTFAFLVATLGVPLQKIVIMFSAAMPTLIAFSFYFTVKSLFGSKILGAIGLTVAALFTIALSWAPLYWAGLPLLFSLYFTISGLGLILVLVKNKLSWVSALFLGLVFFYASNLYPDALLLLTIWLVLISITILWGNYLKSYRGIPSYSNILPRKRLSHVFAFVVPILFAAPYLLRVYNDTIAGRLFFELSPSSLQYADTVISRINFNWLIDVPSFSVFFSEFGKLLVLAPLSIFLLIVLFIPAVSKKISAFLPDGFRHSLLLIYLFLLLILSYLALTLFLPVNLMTTLLMPDRVWQHIFIPGVILASAVLYFSGSFLVSGFKRLFIGSGRRRVVGVVIVLLLLPSTAFVGDRLFYDGEWQYSRIDSSFDIYQTLGPGDLAMMRWISDNIPSDKKILVSYGDSGQFAGALTGRQVVSKDSGFGQYNQLMTMLTSGMKNSSVIVQVLNQCEISYIYVGSTFTTYDLEIAYRNQINATQLLTIPDFELVKEINGVRLYEFIS